jgi:hypothetical protein
MPTNDDPNDGGKMVTPARERIPDSIPGGTDEPAAPSGNEPACAARVPFGVHRSLRCGLPRGHRLEHDTGHVSDPFNDRRTVRLRWGFAPVRASVTSLAGVRDV